MNKASRSLPLALALAFAAAPAASAQVATVFTSPGLLPLNIHTGEELRRELAKAYAAAGGKLTASTSLHIVRPRPGDPPNLISPEAGVGFLISRAFPIGGVPVGYYRADARTISHRTRAGKPVQGLTVLEKYLGGGISGGAVLLHLAHAAHVTVTNELGPVKAELVMAYAMRMMAVDAHSKLDAGVRAFARELAAAPLPVGTKGAALDSWVPPTSDEHAWLYSSHQGIHRAAVRAAIQHLTSTDPGTGYDEISRLAPTGTLPSLAAGPGAGGPSGGVFGISAATRGPPKAYLQ